MKRIMTYIMLSVIVLVLSGCSDFLVREPKLSQSNELTLSTYTGLNSAVAGAYSYISATGWYGQSWIIDADMRSGNGVKDKVRDSNRCAQGYNWNYTPDNTSEIWASAYVLTSAVNNVIDNLEGKEDGDVTKQDLDNLKAESLFLRAFAHFHCVLTYAQPYTYDKTSLGVPVVLHTDPKGKPARETVEKVYGQIVADLLEAESIIDPEYVRKGGADEKSYASIDVIRAFLSRVYLYMGEWQNAANYATKVIDSGNYTMWTPADYPTVWGKEIAGDGGEVIFEVYGKITNSTWGSWEDLSYLTKPDGSGDPMVSKDLLALYDAADVRYTAGFRTTTTNNESGRLWTNKYPGKGDAEERDCNNVIVLRLSEMYLTRAEAILNGAAVEGVTKEADINIVRTNRNIAAIGSVTAKDIRDERRRELAWEGHYIYDLARWNTAVTRTDFTLGSMNQNVPFPDYRWALPIPQRELNVNPNLEQNEGYSKN